MRLENRTAATVPDGSQSDVDAVVGATLAGPARRGEVLTDVRVLGRGWPNRWRARTLASFRCPSPTAHYWIWSAPVTWWTCSPPAPKRSGADARPQLVATDAVVVLVSEKPKGAGGGSDRVVLVAVGAHAANDVAAAALLQTVTLTFH